MGQGGKMQVLRRVQNSIVENPLSHLGEVPFRFENLRVEQEQRPQGFRYSKFMFSIRAKFGADEIIACGEGVSGEVAKAKALSELIERAALLSFGKIFSAENSNGWAAHPDKEHARINAIFELVERDAVLSQWYCSEAFNVIKSNEFPLDVQEWISADLSLSEFPNLSVLLSTSGIGPSVTCILANDQGLGVCAHATRATLAESIRSALAEVCRAAHSAIRREHWKDSLHLKTGAPGRLGPGAHALYHAYHAPFPQWMFGEDMTWKAANSMWEARIAPLLVGDNSFKFQTVMDRPLFVGFASHSNAIPLRWGSTDAEWLTSTGGARRLNLKKINKEPHIVS
jgi:hypothetical protein